MEDWEGQEDGMIYTVRSLAITQALHIASHAPEGQCRQVIVETMKGQKVIWTSDNGINFPPNEEKRNPKPGIN